MDKLRLIEEGYIYYSGILQLLLEKTHTLKQEFQITACLPSVVSVREDVTGPLYEKSQVLTAS